MKITKITTYRLPPRWMFLKIETDEGVVGWGEPVIEGRARTVEAAVHELGDYLIGQDPSRINDLWQVMYRAGFYRGGPILMSAIAGIDQALWDIKGKVLNAPVWQLMGGLVRDKIKAYSWVGGDRPADVIDGIKTLREIGFDTFKLNGCEELGLIDNSRAVDAAVNTVAQIREAFGNQIEFGLDFHGRVSAPMAKVLIKELEPYRPLFIGDTLSPKGEKVPELFIVELPQDEAGWKAAGDAPLSGTETTLPAPPRGVVQRRLTFTHHRAYPGLVNVPRHWVRCNPQGTQIAFLMRDDNGIMQLWLISPQGGEPRQLTHNKTDIQSAFNWHPSGEWLGFVLDNRIACAHAQSGEVEYLTENHANPPSADAVVFSPDGQWLAWMEGGQLWITETDR